MPEVEEPSVCAETWSSTTSTSTCPSSSVNRHRRRAVASSATGASRAPRVKARTSPTSSAGGVRRRTARASLTRTSSRLSPATGSFRCHPASCPPRRRRNVTPARANRRSSVSKYTASNACSSGPTKASTPARPSHPGSSTPSASSYFRSVSRTTVVTAPHLPQPCPEREQVMTSGIEG